MILWAGKSLLTNFLMGTMIWVFFRYMVAKKHLTQGELILKEEAVLVGPHLNGPARCFKCLKTINLLMCSFCNQCNTALMCTNDCQGTSGFKPHNFKLNANCLGKHHSEDECLTLRTQKIKGQILAENPSVIFPLRCLLLGIYKPAVYEEIISMESHLEKRRNTPIWRRHKISVEDILKDTNLISQRDLEGEVVQKICGILDVNSIEVKSVRFPFCAVLVRWVCLSPNPSEQNPDGHSNFSRFDLQTLQTCQ